MIVIFVMHQHLFFSSFIYSSHLMVKLDWIWSWNYWSWHALGRWTCM